MNGFGINKIELSMLDKLEVIGLYDTMKKIIDYLHSFIGAVPEKPSTQVAGSGTYETVICRGCAKQFAKKVGEKRYCEYCGQAAV